MANKLKKILAAFLSAATVMCSAPSASAFFFAVEEEIAEEVVEEVVEVAPAPIAPEIDDGGTTYYFYDILFLETPKYSKDPDLSADKVKGDSITLSWNKYKGASYVRLYRYLPSKKKYYRLAELKTGSQGFDYCTYTDDGLQGGTSYNYKIKFFSSSGKELKEDGVKITTKAAAPSLAIKRTSKNAYVYWTSRQKNASGYELYYKQQDISNSYFVSAPSSVKSLKSNGFKLLKSSSQTASGKTTLKVNKPYSLVACTYKLVNGKKVYSDLTPIRNTFAPGAWINNTKLNPKAVTKGEELKLVEKYVNSVIKKGMSNEEKLQAIFDLVHSHGNYQNDIYKIDGSRPVWQIMEKQEGQCASWAFCLDAMLEYVGFDIRVVRGTRPSGQHFWCQIAANGKYYDLDAHLGDFMVEHKGSYRDYVIVETF